MEIQLVRDTFTEQSTLGHLRIDNDPFACDVLERPRVDLDHPCIPQGRYEVVAYDSPTHGKDTPLLKDVPGRNFIEIHPANYPHELLGCLAPGFGRDVDTVWQSRLAWAALHAKIAAAWANAERVWLTITEVA